MFFVHNRVSSINRIAAQLSELVPEARIAVAHGQLSEHALEEVIVEFWERRFDVLVTTTIIETGIDIANANTLIIDQADKFGLSQLHQIRGRVGRGRERAYAYFLYDEDKPLTELAQDRLETIAANNELGGGMQIALKDLEIRGAGNLLGGEQSGHIAGVGFDLYLRMIGEAVSTFRGDVAEGQTELRLELPVDAHIPEDYVESERLRLEAYQKLSTAAAPASPDDAIDTVVEELTDRYGDPPVPVQNLVAVSRLRRLAQKAGLSEVVAMGGKLRVAPAELPDSIQVRMQRLYPGARQFTEAKALSVPMLVGIANPQHTDDELIDWVTGLLTALFPAPAAVPAVARSPPDSGRCRLDGLERRRPIVQHPRQQHERAQVDDRVDRDDEQDRPAHDVDERQREAEHGRHDHAGELLVQVQHPEQDAAEQERDGSVADDPEDERGQGEAEERLLEDPGREREPGAVGQLGLVAGEQGPDVADRRHLVDRVAQQEDRKQHPDQEQHREGDRREHAERRAEELPNRRDRGPRLRVGEHQRHVLPRRQQHRRRQPAHQQRRLDEPLAVGLLPQLRRPQGLEPCVLATLPVDRAPHEQAEDHEQEGEKRGLHLAILPCGNAAPCAQWAYDRTSDPSHRADRIHSRHRG